LGDGLRECLRIFRFDYEASCGLLDDFLRLAFDSEDDGTRAGHEFEHFRGDDGLEDVGFLEQDEAGVGGGNEGGNFFARLLIKEENVGQALLLRLRLDARFFRAFADEDEENFGIVVLELGCGGEKSFEAVGVAHGADIADEKFFFGVELAADGSVGGVGLGREEIGLDAVFDDGNFFYGDAPVVDEMSAEGWSDNDNLVGAVVEESGDFG